MNTDRNLLFGVLALQSDLIDQQQFAQACAAWAVGKDVALAEILLKHRWITPQDRADVDKLVERKLRRHGGDARASLAAAADGPVRDILKSVNDSDVRNTLSSLPPPAGHVLMETLVPHVSERSRYTLTRLHGEGGLGKVWIARDKDLNREVALKELQPEQARHEEAWRRFLKEAQVTGQLEHPNIVPVYELTRRREDNQPFYTMKFVRGQTLAEAIRQYRTRHPRALPTDPLELPRLLQAFIAICHAMGYAHSRGVVHRDLKPSNVVLGGFGEVIVLDWGLAKVTGTADPEAQTLGISEDAQTDATAAGRALGTPAYMAPEQAEGRLELIDARTDIYGLGSILFEILAGRAPHPGNDTAAVLNRIIHEPTPRVRDAAASTGKRRASPQNEQPTMPALEAICAKAMSKARDERYAKAADLADDVQRWLADEPVSCFSDPLAVRARRWMKRHRTLVTSSAAALAIFVSSLTVLSILVAFHNRVLDGKNTELKIANAAERRATEEATSKRLEAEQARERESLAREKAEAVSKYLVRAFRGPDPGVDGRKITVAEILEFAVSRLDEDFPDQPLIRAELLDAIGQSYYGLGLTQQAANVFEGAVDLRQRYLDNRHADTLASINSLAGAYMALGQMHKALPLFEQTLQQQRETLGPDHRESLTTSNNLAVCYQSTGQLAKALPLLETTSQRLRDTLGPNDPDTLEAMNNLARAYQDDGQLDKALPLRRCKTISYRVCRLSLRERTCFRGAKTDTYSFTTPNGTDAAANAAATR